ncbi:S26 family signal peptidase, partial [Sinorhizobium meliloti]|uniref:S26 family signal peptidase n=1 Tax=Rhizobium meliloti TaxID=382 RepID=UPI001F3D2E51
TGHHARLSTRLLARLCRGRHLRRLNSTRLQGATLIKTVAAVGGQRIEIADNVTIDGRPIANSSLVSQDGQGRPLRPYAGGTIPAGFLFLHSPFPGSWDSRYFGPVPGSGVLGLAEQVLTYAP